MFIKTGHLHLTYLFPIIVVVRALVSQLIQESRVQNRWVAKPHAFILPRSIKWVPGTPGDWVVKSKRSPLRGSVALRQLNPIRKKEP